MMDDTSNELNRPVAVKHAWFQRTENQNLLFRCIHRRQQGRILDGLKMWPEASPLIEKARAAWKGHKKQTLRNGRAE